MSSQQFHTGYTQYGSQLTEMHKLTKQSVHPIGHSIANSFTSLTTSEDGAEVHSDLETIFMLLQRCIDIRGKGLRESYTGTGVFESMR